MKVLVIPEDPTYNGYILKPLVERLLRSAGKPGAGVTVLSSPFTHGYDRVKSEMPAIVERYRHMDLLLFLPDRDGRDLDQELAALEQSAEAAGVKLLACAAVEEVEAWLLAGHVDKLPERWQVVRGERDLKERHFAPFLQAQGDESVGQGRARLMRETLANFEGLLARCPELKTLQARLREKLAAAA